MTFGVFREIERLLDNIPLHINTDGTAELGSDTTIDSKFYFKDVDGVATRLGVIEAGKNYVSIRDIVKLFNKFLINSELEELVVNPVRYRESQINSSGVPVKSLLFDFCLSALSGNIFDAKLYLRHSSNIIGIRMHIILLLSSIISYPHLTESDGDVRRLLTHLAAISEPHNIDVYFNAEEGGFNKRYVVYLKEINNLSNEKTNYESNNIIKISQKK